jgi:hypothetical protein
MFATRKFSMQTTLDSCFRKPLPVESGEKRNPTPNRATKFSPLRIARRLAFDNPDDPTAVLGLSVFV